MAGECPVCYQDQCADYAKCQQVIATRRLADAQEQANADNARPSVLKLRRKLLNKQKELAFPVGPITADDHEKIMNKKIDALFEILDELMEELG